MLKKKYKNTRNKTKENRCNRTVAVSWLKDLSCPKTKMPICILSKNNRIPKRFKKYLKTSDMHVTTNQ